MSAETDAISASLNVVCSQIWLAETGYDKFLWFTVKVAKLQKNTVQKDEGSEIIELKK